MGLAMRHRLKWFIHLQDQGLANAIDRSVRGGNAALCKITLSL